MQATYSLNNLVLEKAQNMGFTSQVDCTNHWQIFPINLKEAWILTMVESRWILSIENVPQIYLRDEEAISFLRQSLS